MKVKFFTLLVSIFLATMAMAQNPEAVFKKTTEKPVIDGVVDAVWTTANVYNIDKPFQAEVPTLGDPGQTTWQALWDADGVYVLLTVTDDSFFPSYMANPSSTANWEYDKPELYFDVNYDLSAMASKIQIAPGFTDGKNNGTPMTDNQIVYAFKVNGSNYIAEYFIPNSKLTDKSGIEVDKTNTIGFDVTIIDRDPGDASRKRAVWANIGLIDESNNNWLNCGRVTFEDAEAPVFVDKITLTGGPSITTDNGTSQMDVVILPVNASNQKLKWSVVGGTGKVTISATGVVKGLIDGTVTLIADALDGGYATSNEVTINVSGQVVKIDEINMIKNGYFTLGTDGKEFWRGDGVVEGEESWYSVVCVPKIGIWDTMFGQGVIVADASTNYIVKFKAKASADMTVPMLFEDRGNFNNKVVTTSSEYRDNGYGKWDIPITTEAKWFTIDVTFSNFKEVSAYELNFQVGMVDGTFSLDSVQMYSEADLALVSTGVKNLAINSIKVYPNPVGNATHLSVTLSTSNARVAIYNTIGQKIMEKVSIGNIATFDVSNLRKGIYIVKLSDGSSQKFIR